MDIRDIRMLGKFSTRDEAGRHFTEIYPAVWLDRMESLGMIEIQRPTHEGTGLQYSQEYWTASVTETAIDEGEARGWGAYREFP